MESMFQLLDWVIEPALARNGMPCVSYRGVVYDDVMGRFINGQFVQTGRVYAHMSVSRDTHRDILASPDWDGEAITVHTLLGEVFSLGRPAAEGTQYILQGDLHQRYVRVDSDGNIVEDILQHPPQAVVMPDTEWLNPGSIEWPTDGATIGQAVERIFRDGYRVDGGII